MAEEKKKLVLAENLSTFAAELKTKVDAIKTAIGNVSVEDLIGSEVTTTELNYLAGLTGRLSTLLEALAPKNSPAFTGVPTAPTATAGTKDTQIATTAFVDATVSKAIEDADISDKLSEFAKTSDVEALIAASEKKIFGDGELAEAFDTIKEISDYLKDHDDVAKSINEAIAKKADKTELSAYAKTEAVEGMLEDYVKTDDFEYMTASEVKALFTDW